MQIISTNIKSRAIKGAGATILAQVTSFIVQLLGTVILGRLLTPLDFGLVTMVTTFSLLLQNIGLNGFTEAIIQREDLDESLVNAIFWLNAIISVVLTMMFMALSPLISMFYKEPRLSAITVGIACSIFISGLGTIHLALLKRTMQFSVLSLTAIMAKIISVVMMIILAATGYGYWALVAGAVFLPTVYTVCAWLKCDWRPSMNISAKGTSSIVQFALNVYGNFSVNYCTRNLDNLLIGLKYGSVSLGFYKKAYDLFALSVNQLTAPLTAVAIAALSRLRNDVESYKRYYLEALSIIAFTGMCISMMLTLTGKDMILLVLGSQWTQAGDIFTYFGPGVGLMLIYGTHGWLHLSLGTPDMWFQWALIEFLLTAILFIIGVYLGLELVAVAWTISFCILTIPGLWFAGRSINLTMASIIQVIWKYTVAAVFSGILCWLLLHKIPVLHDAYNSLNILLRILGACSIAFTLYLILVILLHGGTEQLRRAIYVFQSMLPDRFLKRAG